MANNRLWDVVVIGAGVNGAATANALANAGYQVLAIDRGDIGGGTSQASTMLVWGGLLYLKNWELRAVRELCRERDRLISTSSDQVRLCEIRYLPTPGRRPRAAILAALTAYWALSAGRRRRARTLIDFPERALLHGHQAEAFGFEEASVRVSDARFVLDVIGQAESHGAEVRTYQRVERCTFDRACKRWRISLSDALSGAATQVEARCIVNATGPWADEVNAVSAIETPYRHVLSRGVSLTVQRDPLHHAHLVFDTDEGNALTLAPWGPVSLWASTESMHTSVEEASRIAPADVTNLIDQYNRRFRVPIGIEDIVALRVGVRPVPVTRGQAVDARGLGLSRHHRLHMNADSPWLTIFGGKLSGCHGLARDVELLIARRIPLAAGRAPAAVTPRAHAVSGDVMPTVSFPGVPTPIVAPHWSAVHQRCRTLSDYLRRRTNIAQWVPCGGFGRYGEHATLIHGLARAIHAGDEAAAIRDVASYREAVEADATVLGACRADLGTHPLGVSA